MTASSAAKTADEQPTSNSSCMTVLHSGRPTGRRNATRPRGDPGHLPRGVTSRRRDVIDDVTSVSRTGLRCRRIRSRRVIDRSRSITADHAARRRPAPATRSDAARRRQRLRRKAAETGRCTSPSRIHNQTNNYKTTAAGRDLFYSQFRLSSAKRLQTIAVRQKSRQVVYGRL